MLRFLIISQLLFVSAGSAQTRAPDTLRATLLAELHSSHDKAEWFVPLNTAVAGLAADQAKWVPVNSVGTNDSNANHSVGMLAYHLWFWNSRALAKFKNGPLPQAPGNNDETFNEYTATSWPKTVRDLDQVMKSLEDLVAHADDADLARWAPTIANICTHNAYHTGQILYVRKLQGVWNASNGVK